MERVQAGGSQGRKKSASVSSDKGEEGPLTTGAFQQILTAVTTTMMVQQQELQRQQHFFTLQQQQFADLMHQVLERKREVAVEMLEMLQESPRTR